MTRKWLAAAVALGLLTGESAKANVTYAIFDLDQESVLDLSFTVAKQLSLTERSEKFLSVGGLFAVNFLGGNVIYHQDSPDYQPVLQIGSGGTNYVGDFTFTTFPSGDPSNGVPGDGSFLGRGDIIAQFGPNASLGSAIISGISGMPVVPEPATWVLLALGFLGLALAPGLRLWRRRPSATA
jgi:hypothetical protein